MYAQGSFFLTRTSGAIGYAIALAQALAGDASRWTHAGLILNEAGDILEAEPHGARLSNLSAYSGRPLLISDEPVRQWLDANTLPGDPKGRAAVEATVRGDIVAWGKKLVGTPYSFADYAAIGALHLHIPSKALRRYVASSGHCQCAQLVDLAYTRAGVHLFADGRQPGDVCPADLAAYAEDHAAVSA